VVAEKRGPLADFQSPMWAKEAEKLIELGH